MLEPPEVVDVDGWEIVRDETVGASEKAWIRNPTSAGSPQDLWLFKPVVVHDNGTVQGGDWAELIASQVAVGLGVSSATIRMATRGGQPGTLSQNVRPDIKWDRFEGSLWLDADSRVTYRIAEAGASRRKRGASPGYSLEAIRDSLQGLGPPPQARGGFEGLDAFDNFCGFLVLDALISNRDRHEQNWSVLRPVAGGGQVVLAAAYDNEGSLGYNLTDPRRELLLADGDALEEFSSKGTAWRYDWGTGPIPSLVEAARRGLMMGTEEGRRVVINSVETFPMAEVVEYVESVPRMSAVARNFSVNLLKTNLERLRDGLRDLGSRSLTPSDRGG